MSRRGTGVTSTSLSAFTGSSDECDWLSWRNQMLSSNKNDCFNTLADKKHLNLIQLEACLDTVDGDILCLNIKACLEILCHLAGKGKVKKLKNTSKIIDNKCCTFFLKAWKL